MHLFSHRTCWEIEREHPGQYHNSPSIWRSVGLIRARNRREAMVRADEIIRIGNARVRPVEDHQS